MLRKQDRSILDVLPYCSFYGLTLSVVLLVVAVGCKKSASNASKEVPTAPLKESTSDVVGAADAVTAETPLDSSSVTLVESTPNAVDGSDTDRKQVRSTVTTPRTTAANGQAKLVSFDDLNIGMPPDAKFRPLLLEYNDGQVKKLFGQRINLAGYIAPPDKLKGLDDFILLKNLDCKFGPGGQADHLVHVIMQGGETTDFTDKVVYVEGELQLKPFPEDGPSTWSIYDLKATKVSTKPPPRR